MANNKYNQLKRQYSLDGGLTWHDLLPMVYKVGNVIETNSDCVDESGCRWVILPISEAYDCDSNYNLYQIEAEECLQPNGTFKRTGNIRRYQLVDTYSVLCGYTGITCTPSVRTEYSYSVVYNGGAVEYNQYATPVVSEIKTVIETDKGCVETSSSTTTNITDYSISYNPSGNNTSDEERNVRATVTYNDKIIGSFEYIQKNRFNGSSDIEFTFNTESLEYNLNGDVYTATTSPYSTTLSNLGIDGLTNCYGTFMQSSLTELIKFPDTSQVDVMDSMFESCHNLTSLDLSSFDTTNLQSMINMFFDCTGLTSLNVSSFNTSNVTEMGGLFSDCHSLTSLNVSNFDTSNNTIFDAMFSFCESLTSLDLSNFNTSNAISFGGMFNGCSSLKTLDLSMFDTSKAENGFGLMFKDCTSLETLDLSNWKYVNEFWAGYKANMFSGCAKLTSITLNNVDCETYNFIKNEVEIAGLSSQVTITTDVENCTTNNPFKLTELEPLIYNTSTLPYTIFEECIEVGNNGWGFNFIYRLNGTNTIFDRRYILDTNTNILTTHNFIPYIVEYFCSYGNYEILSSNDFNGNLYFTPSTGSSDTSFGNGTRPLYVYDKKENKIVYLTDVISSYSYNYSTNRVLYEGLTLFPTDYLNNRGIAIDKDFNISNVRTEKIATNISNPKEIVVYPDLKVVYNGIDYYPQFVFKGFGKYETWPTNDAHPGYHTIFLLNGEKVENIDDAIVLNNKYLFFWDVTTSTISLYDGVDIKTTYVEGFNNELYDYLEYPFYLNENTIVFKIGNSSEYEYVHYDLLTNTAYIENSSFPYFNTTPELDGNTYPKCKFYSEVNNVYFDETYVYKSDGTIEEHKIDLSEVLPYDYYMTINGDIVFFNNRSYKCIIGYSSCSNVVAYFDGIYPKPITYPITITYNGSGVSVNYKINGVSNTITTANSIDNGDGTYTYKVSSYDLPTSITSLKNMCNDRDVLSISFTEDFDTSKVTTMEQMFYNCYNLTSLDLSMFDTSACTNIENMFANCYDLTTLDVSSWDFIQMNIYDTNNMFFNCDNLTTLKVKSGTYDLWYNILVQDNLHNNVTIIEV